MSNKVPADGAHIAILLTQLFFRRKSAEDILFDYHALDTTSRPHDHRGSDERRQESD